MGPISTRWWQAGLVASALLALACGSSEPEVQVADAAPAPKAAKPAPKPVSNADPVIDDIDFRPAPPVPGGKLHAVVTARDADGDQLWFDYQWRIDGRDAELRASGNAIDLSDAVRGQRVEVVVVASDGKGKSAPYDARVELENRPPVVTEVNVEPGREVVTGTPVRALSTARDADGDPLDFTYTWRVNGREVRADGAVLETQRMRRGDEIRLTVTAHDGEAASDPAELPPILIVNGPPRVVSVPPSDLEDGTFRYAVVAEDPDGDSHVEFRLENAPSGMQIDPYAGLITWEPGAEQAGLHTVTVFAEDLHDGVGEQKFEVRVTAPEDAAPPADEAP